MLKFRDGLEFIKPYAIDEASWKVKLDANERGFNLPPAVSQVVADRLTGLAFNRYPEISQRSLREMIAAGLEFGVNNITVGNGSSELLAALCMVFGGKGRKTIIPTPSFSMYPIYCKLADSQPVNIHLEDDFSLEPAKVIDAARREQAGLILLCNPNNPTGKLLPQTAVEQIVREVGCPVVLDEAYAEFSGVSALNLLSRYDKLVIVRTFSKAYGLAAARVGYAIASPEIISNLGKVLLPYHVNAMSLTVAATVFAMKDEFAPGIALIVAERERMAEALAALPSVEVFESATNFLLFKTAAAARLSSYLAMKGIGIRDFSAVPDLEGCLRVTVGTPEENDAFLKAAQECLTEEGKV